MDTFLNNSYFWLVAVVLGSIAGASGYFVYRAILDPIGKDLAFEKELKRQKDRAETLKSHDIPQHVRMSVTLRQQMLSFELGVYDAVDNKATPPMLKALQEFTKFLDDQFLDLDTGAMHQRYL